MSQHSMSPYQGAVTAALEDCDLTRTCVYLTSATHRLPLDELTKGLKAM